MPKELDCRGQACPAPVVQLKEMLDRDALTRVTVLVDNEAARENVCRFLEYQHFQVSTERQGDYFRVQGTREEGTVLPVPAATAPQLERGARKILVLVATNRMGHGDDGLGEKLLINFLKTLKEMGPDLWQLIFINSGVTLTAAGAEAVPILQGLAADGVRILVCGTCLTHFHLLDKKAVGETTNMLDIVTGMQLADSVITI